MSFGIWRLPTSSFFRVAEAFSLAGLFSCSLEGIRGVWSERCTVPFSSTHWYNCPHEAVSKLIKITKVRNIGRTIFRILNPPRCLFGKRMTGTNGTKYLGTCQEIMKLCSLFSNICAKMKKIPQLDLLRNINGIKGLIQSSFVVLETLNEGLIKNWRFLSKSPKNCLIKGFSLWKIQNLWGVTFSFAGNEKGNIRRFFLRDALS